MQKERKKLKVDKTRQSLTTKFISNAEEPERDGIIKVTTPRKEYTLSVGDITANEAIEKVKQEYPTFKEFEYKTITYKKTGKDGEFIKRIDPPEKIEQRWQKKKDHIRELSDNVGRLKNRITRDLKGEDEKPFLTALIIAMILRIGERIGNEESANYIKTSKDDKRKRAFGVSGFKKAHVDIIGNKVHLNYIGKKGVQQDKSFSDEKIAKALKAAIKKSPSSFIFTTSKDQKIGANQVNDYLRDFNITAKGIRGWYCNRGVLDKLKETTPEDSEKKRKKQLNIILKSVAEKVGHGPSVLKNQYLIPEVISTWIDKGEVFDIKEAGYVMKEGGKLQIETEKHEDIKPLSDIDSTANNKGTFEPNNSDIRLENGGNIDDFANSKKIRKFIPTKITKDELQSIISGKSKVSDGDTIQAALLYIRGEKGASSIHKRAEPEREKERLIEFIDKNNLWYSGELSINKYVDRGGEHIVYEDPNDEDFVLKTNNLTNYHSWSDYLINLLLNNTFFPDTSYELIGFKKDEHGKILPVVKQYFVTEAIIANLKDVQKYLFTQGFRKIHPLSNAYRHYDLGVVIGDLHDRNVLLNDDTLFFIDTKFFIALGVDYVYDKGGNLPNNEDFANSKKTSTFIPNPTKDEIENVISGKSRVGKETVIGAVASYLRRSQGTSSLVKGSKQYKEQEAERLKSYITENDLWIRNLDLTNFIDEGCEQKVYLTDKENVVKVNDSIFFLSWEDYFSNLLLHNYFFPDTTYELLGFTQDDGRLFAVVKQPFIKANEKTNLDQVRQFMADNGFVNTKDENYENKELGLILEDLHSENVLTKDGVLYFIDTVFYISSKTGKKYEGGGKIPTLNSEGGYEYSGKDEKVAEHVGLITLPEKIAGTNCENCIFFKDGFCDHEKVLLPVTNRQCCALWNETTLSTIISEFPNADFFPDSKLKNKKYPKNENGGYDYDGEGLARAKNADLITLPKEILGTTCKFGNCKFTNKNNFCTHPKVKLPVTDRMSCSLWDNDKVVRPWGKMKEILFAKGGLIAPNGNPSNLTPEQYKLVRTPEFISWFGDWINDPKNASKVVDINGEPLVVFHGSSNRDITEFRMANKLRSDGVRDYGAYFSNDINTSNFYSADWSKPKGEYKKINDTLNDIMKELPNPEAIERWKKTYKEKEEKFPIHNFDQNFEHGKVYECFLNIKNPLVVEGNCKLWLKVLPNVIDRALLAESDGVIIHEIIEVKNLCQTTFIAFFANQIKLADGTNVSFDGNSSDIRLKSGGEVSNLEALIEQQIEKERKSGMEYPYSVAYREHLKAVKEAKGKKDILSTTSELDYYLRTGDKYSLKEDKDADKIRDLLSELLKEKRREVLPKYDTTKAEKYLNDFIAKRISDLKLRKDFLERADTHTEREIRAIVWKMQNILSWLKHPEIIGLYEESQFPTLRQNLSWDFKNLKSIAKKSAYEYYIEYYIEPFEKLIYEALGTKEEGGIISDSAQKQIDEYIKEGIFIKPTDKPIVGVLPISRFNGPDADIFPNQLSVDIKGVEKWKKRIQAGERPYVLIDYVYYLQENRVKDSHHRLVAYEDLGITEMPVIDVNGKVLNASRMASGGIVDGDYKKWKRKNVTYRGMKEIGVANEVHGSLGNGLYTAALSNKSMAKEYGTLYFVVNGRPNNPKKFNSINEWEIWFYNTLVYGYSKAKGKTMPDKRDFNASTTIETELQKLGYDGIEIVGREIVNFKPEDVKYFRTEDEVKDYYDRLPKMAEGGIAPGDKVLSASSRFRPMETIVFEKPIIGLNGNKLISYTWSYEWTMLPNYEGELKSKRVSDWSQAESSADTGKDIVHKFTIQRTDGTPITVSSESVPIILGYTNRAEMKNLPSLVSSVKTLAKQKMQLAILEAQEKEYNELLNKYKHIQKPQVEYVEVSIENIPFAQRTAAKLHPDFIKRYSIFKMGDVSIIQDNPNSYNSTTGKTEYTINKIPSRYTIENLEMDWVSKRVKEDGGKYPQGIYDLRRRVERQERKVNEATNAETKLEEGGTISEIERQRDQLNAEVDKTSNELNDFIKPHQGPDGLVSENIKNSDQYKKLKRDYDISFQKLRQFNSTYKPQRRGYSSRKEDGGIFDNSEIINREIVAHGGIIKYREAMAKSKLLKENNRTLELDGGTLHSPNNEVPKINSPEFLPYIKSIINPKVHNQIKAEREDKVNALESGGILNTIVIISPNNFEPYTTLPDLRAKAHTHLMQYYRNENDYDCFTNINTGINICFYKGGIDKLVSGKLGEIKMKSLKQIDEIIKNAILKEELVPRDPNYLSVMRFVTTIEYKGVQHEYWSVIKEYRKGVFIYSGNVVVDEQ